MPLSKGKSKAAFSQNVKTEMAAGKPQKQALGIAYREQGEEKGEPKKGHGQEEMREHYKGSTKSHGPQDNRHGSWKSRGY